LSDDEHISLDHQPIRISQTPDSPSGPVGVDFVLLKLANGKSLIWFNMEDINTRGYNTIAMIAPTIQCLILFINPSRQSDVPDALSRLVNNPIALIEEKEMIWPKLKLVVNQSTIPDVLTTAFANSASKVDSPRLLSDLSLASPFTRHFQVAI
jgi:hypothetical protein